LTRSSSAKPIGVNAITGSSILSGVSGRLRLVS
jgi:hypothetical protein